MILPQPRAPDKQYRDELLSHSRRQIRISLRAFGGLALVCVSETSVSSVLILSVVTSIFGASVFGSVLAVLQGLGQLNDVFKIQLLAAGVAFVFCFGVVFSLSMIPPVILYPWAVECSLLRQSQYTS